MTARPLVSLALLLLAGACGSPEQSDLAALMSRPTRAFEGEIGARDRVLEDRTEPAGTFRIELPEVYRLHEGRADDGLSSHGFTAGDTFLPSFTIRRAVRPDELERPLVAPHHEARVENGERDGMRWRAEIRVTNSTTITEVQTLRETPVGAVLCSGGVETPEPTPIHGWIVARCATLAVSPR